VFIVICQNLAFKIVIPGRVRVFFVTTVLYFSIKKLEKRDSVKNGLYLRDVIYTTPLPRSVVDVNGELPDVTSELKLNGANVGRMIDGQTGSLLLQIFLFLNPFDQAEDNQSWRFVMCTG